MVPRQGINWIHCSHHCETLWLGYKTSALVSHPGFQQFPNLLRSWHSSFVAASSSQVLPSWINWDHIWSEMGRPEELERRGHWGQHTASFDYCQIPWTILGKGRAKMLNKQSLDLSQRILSFRIQYTTMAKVSCRSLADSAVQLDLIPITCG